MNVSHTIKDKEVPRWRPLQRIPRLRLLVSKLSPKRVLILILFLTTLLFFLRPSYFRGVSIIVPEKRDEDIVKGIKDDLRRVILKQWDMKSPRQTVLFATAHDLRNASTFTELACEMALARKMDVMMIYVGLNKTDSVPFFLHVNKFEQSNCPFVYVDARHEYANLYLQTNAVEAIIADTVIYVNPSVVIYLDDEPDWFLQSLERTTFWHIPAISMIQLKRSALPNLRWISSLSSSTLMGTPLEAKADLAWNIPSVDIVITTSQRNTGTLYRLIESLLSAEYIQPISPRLFITFNPNTTTPAILKLLSKWPADRLVLRHQIHPLHTSFPGALQSWYPSDNDNYALVLQDDIELSPWYMYWIHLTLMKYVYSSDLPTSSSLALLSGISLQSAPQPNSATSDKRTLDIRRALLMAPMYTGWTDYATPYIWQSTLFHSTLFFPQQWKEFHTYISIREHFGGGIPAVSNFLRPYSKDEVHSLEVYWSELFLARGYAILYPNFDDAASFARPHRLASLDDTPDVDLSLINWAQFLDQVNDGLPDWEDLPVLDYEKNVVGWDQLERNALKISELLSTCEEFPKTHWDVRDLFCFPQERYRGRHEEDDLMDEMGNGTSV